MVIHSRLLGWRILRTEEPAGYSPQGREELDMIEQLTLHYYPLQYSCLKNSMDRGPWWTTDHVVEKSQT